MDATVAGRVGRTYAHYRLVELRGEGGMGAVYRAEDTLLGRTVALKFPRHEGLEDPSARARFLREARAASALDHPNIVVLFDVCEADEEIFLAMQYVEGPTLRERLARGPLPLEETLAIGRAVADALAHAHGRGVVHRDVKPENVLLSGEGRAKVADFGMALLPGEARLTRTGVAVGTPLYLAPEVARGERADPRSDLFSLGAVLYELCAGRPPFHGEGLHAVLYRILNAEPPPLPAAVPVGLRELIAGLLRKSREARLQGAAAVADALARLGEGAAPRSGERAAPPARSIAVLPFENLTGSREDDHFCAGIAEDLLTEMLKIPDLRICSRAVVESLKGSLEDLRRSAGEIGVATVLEGGVRRAGERVRVTARLLRTDDGQPIWGERYDRDLRDIFEVQEDIARQIAGALKLALEPEDEEARLGRRTRSPQAYDLRLRALALHRNMVQPDMRAAIALLEESLRADPHYARARADLAECCIQMVCKSWDLEPSWLDRAEREARSALEQAPGLPEGYRALGHLLNHRRRPDLALRQYHRAVELDPRYASAHGQLGSTYLFVGDPSRSEVYLRRARDLDPLNTTFVSTLAEVLLRQRRVAESREAALTALAMRPPALYALALRFVLVLGYGGEGNLAEVAREAGAVRREFGEETHYARAVLALAAAYLGRGEEARGLADPAAYDGCQVREAFEVLARAHMLLGDRPAALAALERAEALGLVDVDGLWTDPLLSALRGDPTFERIAAGQDGWAAAARTRNAPTAA